MTVYRDVIRKFTDERVIVEAIRITIMRLLPVVLMAKHDEVVKPILNTHLSGILDTVKGENVMRLQIGGDAAECTCFVYLMELSCRGLPILRSSTAE